MKILPLNDYVIVSNLNKEPIKEGMFYSSEGVSQIRLGRVVEDSGSQPISLEGKEVFFRASDSEILNFEASEFWLVSKSKLLAYIDGQN